MAEISSRGRSPRTRFSNGSTRNGSRWGATRRSARSSGSRRSIPMRCPARLPQTTPEASGVTMLDALVVAPHPDDAELGMGGTIIRLLGQGWKVGILDLTSGEPTPLGSPEQRAAETAAANAALGNPWRKNLGLPNRNLEPT